MPKATITTLAQTESTELSGYVISLQKLDALIRNEVRRGNIIINTTHFADLGDKTFSL